MSAITGMFRVGDRTKLPEWFLASFARLLHASHRWGTDGFGYVLLMRDGSYLRSCTVDKHGICSEQDTLARSLLNWVGLDGVLCHHTTDPTAEGAPKTLSDQQPYVLRQMRVAHVGTIVNDAEVLAGVERPTQASSWVVAYQAHKAGPRSITNLLGSQATAVVEYQDRNHELFLYRDYQPLYLIYVPACHTFVFSSLPDLWDLFGREVSLPVPIPPYSFVHGFGLGGSVKIERRYLGNQGRVGVLCSGGLDSTVAATIARQCSADLYLLHFLYGCRAEAREITAVRAIADHLSAEVLPFDMSWLKQLGGSTLTAGGDIAEHTDRTKTRWSHEWVPARNLAMLGAAAACADRFDLGRLYFGATIETAYCDSSPDFVRSCAETLQLGTYARPSLVCPLLASTKRDIVQKAYEINAPIHLSWSCFHGGSRHCGRCRPCYARRLAHRMIGREDCIQYEDSQ